MRTVIKRIAQVLHHVAGEKFDLAISTRVGQPIPSSPRIDHLFGRQSPGPSRLVVVVVVSA